MFQPNDSQLYSISNTNLWNRQIALTVFIVMCNFWHTLLHVEGGEYLVEVEVEVPAIFAWFI